MKVDATRISRGAAKISDEVIQHLQSQLGASVEVTVEIQADAPDGFPDNIVRESLNRTLGESKNRDS